MSSPKYDVVLYGATGFTGSLTAQYLAEHPQQPRVAFAGRNRSKLEKVLQQLTNVSKERVQSIDLIEASASDKASLIRMAQSAKVVMNLVGPYSQLGGKDVARAAVEAGASYVDLTGETGYYAELVQQLHGLAQKTKSIVMPSVGFDSLPFDLGTYLAVQEVKKAAGPDAQVERALCGYNIKHTVSGGTIATIVGGRDHPEELGYTRPYWFSPVQGAHGQTTAEARYLPQFNKWGSFSFFTPHNTRVVSRSWGLLEESAGTRGYGHTFQYLEALVTPNRVMAYVQTKVFLMLTWLVVHVAFIGNMMCKMIPQGTGGSMDEQLKGYADVRTLATAKGTNAKGLSVIQVKGDPGYLKTASMISEAALSIALDYEKLSPLAKQGGVLTPATFGGDVLADRLVKHAGFTITCADVTQAKDLSKALEPTNPIS